MHITLEHVELVLTFISSFALSSGFWIFLDKVRSKTDFRDKLLIGLAHDRIIELGIKYLRRNYITQDEYENLHDFLYVPYVGMGGNGTAKKIMDEIEKMPIAKSRVFGKEES